jgi:pimeloyl-ACP methyl ester carboxylesterase
MQRTGRKTLRPPRTERASAHEEPLSAMKKPPKKSPRASKKGAGASKGSTERVVQADGLAVRCIESGQGNPVVVIEGPGETALSALASLLAQEFHVIALAMPAPNPPGANAESGSTREMARTLGHAAAAAGLERYVLVAGSANVTAALWQAIEGNERVEALVLIAPRGLVAEVRSAANGIEQDRDLDRRLEEIKVPTLVLLGTNEETVPREMARTYAQRIPTSYVVLVYDAGEAIETERPEALLGALRDFVERREKFVVNSSSTAINP